MKITLSRIEVECLIESYIRDEMSLREQDELVVRFFALGEMAFNLNEVTVEIKN